MKTIALSKHLGVDREALEKAGVFDATLGIDTRLFVDPKLLVDSDIEEFNGSREKILRYFRQLIRVHRQSPKSQRLADEARDMLAVPEPEGLSIGYGSKTDNGTSIPDSVAYRILRSISEILAVGIEDAEVVELLAVFVEGFGPDSISDLAIHIIYEDFCAFTARVSKDLGVETKEYTIDGKKFLLPTHPFSKNQLIFVPYSLLRELPVATSWDEIRSAAQHNAEVRQSLEDIVKPAISEILEGEAQKDEAKMAAMKENLAALLDVYKQIQVESYNLQSDDKGYYHIDPFIDQEASRIHAKGKPRNVEELIYAVQDLIKQFARAIEDNGGNNLLYRRTKTGAVIPTKPHNEDVAQRIFYMIADLFCRQANIMLAGESDAGRGPVDFSLGTGYEEKVIVEIKKSDNKNLVDGFKKQVEAYEKSEHAAHSFFVVVIVKEHRAKKDRIPQLDTVIGLYEENKRVGIKSPELIIVDGLIRASPSKLRSVNPIEPS